MKRIVSLLLTLSFCFALCACSSVKENSQPTTGRQEAPQATVLDGLAVPGTVAQNSADEATADVLEIL